MNLAESALETSKAVFFAHLGACDKCSAVHIGDTKTLSQLCYQGLLFFRTYMDCEEAVLAKKKSKEKAKEAKAIRREQHKQLEAQK